MGERIVSWRKSRGLSQAELAKAIGVQPPSVCAWEKGNAHPRPEHLEKLCAVLGIDLPTFYGPMPEPTPEPEPDTKSDGDTAAA